MKRSILFYALIFTFFSCNHGYQEIFQLKDKQGKLLGTVYVHYVKGKIFNSLLILKENGTHSDTLFTIDQNGFKNPQGTQMDIQFDGDVGFMIDSRTNDSFIVFLHGNDGKGASDPAPVQWNYKKHKFELDMGP